VPASHVERDWARPYEASEEVERAWLVVYRDPQAHWDLYQLGEELVDLEDAFRLWRFRHVTTVERIIGFKTGTGGTAGVSYLRKMLDVVLFPEIWTLRTAL
jgi:tryptophan 2,3-dioxygenase